MATQRKIDSARTNGAKSHGPITEEGHLVLEMVNAKWRQRRLCNIESALFDQRMDRQKGESDTTGDSRNASAEYSRALSNLLHLQRCRHVTFEARNKKSEKRTESQVRTIANYQRSIVTDRSLLDPQPFVASTSLGQPAARHECTFSTPYSWNNSRSCS
jgi:hypothetical protein